MVAVSLKKKREKIKKQSEDSEKKQKRVTESKGQALYIEAEEEGLSGTGMGWYIDERVNELLGNEDERWKRK